MTTQPERPDERLSGALDRFAPEARASFREELQQRFVGGAGLSLEEALDQQAPPAPRGAFREELRARFLAEAQAEDAPAAPTPRPVRTRRPASAGRRRRHGKPEAAGDPRSRLRLLVGGGLAAVAAAAAVVVLLTRPGPTSPETTGAPTFLVDGTELSMDGLRVDGELVPADTTAEGLAALLAGAATVRAGASPVRFLFRDQFAVEIDSGTSLDLTGLAPGSNPWVLRNAGEQGQYRVATAEGFDGASHPLEFHTPARSLRVVGTTFGVDVFAPDTVCICCNEGEVETFLAPGGPTETVTGDGTLFTDPSGITRKTHLVAHQEPLKELRDFLATWP